MSSVLSYSAHSAELSRFCLLFQLHFVVVYSAVFADSSSSTKCPRMTVEVFYNNAFCCLSPVSHSYATSLVDCFSSLMHAGVSTSLNSAMASLGPS